MILQAYQDRRRLLGTAALGVAMGFASALNHAGAQVRSPGEVIQPLPPGFRPAETDPGRRPECRLCRDRAVKRPAGHPASRLALRHSHLRGSRAVARRNRLPRHRAVSSRLWRHPLHVGRYTRNGQQCVFAADTIALMDALQIEQAVIAGCDWGARTACIIAALWPERCKALVSVSGYLIGNQQVGTMPLPPKAELAWWYQFYFATERGRLGYAANRNEFARLIWKTASPNWAFDEATFARSAAAFLNPDHVAIVIDNYRWRIGLAAGEPQYDAFEARLATAPVITVPTVTLESDANGAPHPEPSASAGKFSGRYKHLTIGGGIGHNLPQEAPRALSTRCLRQRAPEAKWDGFGRPKRVARAVTISIMAFDCNCRPHPRLGSWDLTSPTCFNRSKSESRA